MILTEAQCQHLERTWRNVDIVISRLPLSEVSALLSFHTRNLLDRLANPPVEIEYVTIVTKRINALVKTAPALLDIDDMLALINRALETLTESETSPPV